MSRLAPCPQCARPASTAARACPHCGYPIARKAPMNPFILLFVVTMIFSPLICAGLFPAT